MNRPRKVAIIGANGFVGSRLVEMFHLGGVCEVVPVVRAVKGLPRVCRFDLDWRLADARDVDALSAAMQGCDSVVHCVVGDPHVIESAATALVPALTRAGVSRAVYLSSASVHGQNPAPGTCEDSPLSDRQNFGYNNAKVRAERILFREAQRHRVELIALRPPIVFGPRDRWITMLVTELESGVAWLVNEGRGICNTIYVDNLVRAIQLALIASAGACGRPYLVGDAETITWRELYDRTAAGLGLAASAISLIDAPRESKRSWVDSLHGIRVLPATQKAIAKVPRILKDTVKGALRGLKPEALPNPWPLPVSPKPNPSREMISLQQCAVRLPQTAARDLLGYQPVVTFDEGLRRTLEWIQWARS